MTRMALAAMGLVLLGGCAGMEMQHATGESEHAFADVVERHVGYRYLLYLPRDYNASRQSWPLLIFLHGSGEAGDDLAQVRTHGPPRLVHEGRDFPFIIVSPQAPRVEPWDIEALDLLLAHVEQNLRVDADRVYLTGLSNGGKGVWTWASARPQLFAAIAPVAGFGDPNRVCGLVGTPVWAFHGARDDVVPPVIDTITVEALRRCGGDVRYTLYEDANHDSWTRTYENPDLYAWFLSHRLSHTEKS